MVEEVGQRGGKLVLLVDGDPDTRRHAREMLELRGLDVVQASNGIAALELIQRLPESFRLVVTELDLPGISGSVVAETLRLFRPELRVLCISRARATAGGSSNGCLANPLNSDELRVALADPQNGWDLQATERLPESVTARARAQFAVSGDLVEAAFELARGAVDEV